MRTFLSIYGSTVCLAIMVLLVAVPAWAADAGACYAISNPDQRAYCLARAHQDPGRCYVIKDAGVRSMCLAEVRK